MWNPSPSFHLKLFYVFFFLACLKCDFFERTFQERSKLFISIYRNKLLIHLFCPFFCCETSQLPLLRSLFCFLCGAPHRCLHHPPSSIIITKTGITEIETVAGTSVDIPCNITSWTNDEVSLVLWFRGDTGVPIYRVDARNVPLEKSTHTTADELRKRFHFDINSKPPVLRIDPVMASDAAEYRCRVDFRQSRTQNVIVLLNVTGLNFQLFTDYSIFL